MCFIHPIGSVKKNSVGTRLTILIISQRSFTYNHLMTIHRKPEAYNSMKYHTDILNIVIWHNNKLLL